MRYSLVAGILGTCLLVGTTLVGSARVAADDVLDNTLDNTLDNAVEKVMRDSFAGATPEHWKSRLEQDEVQAYCSRFRNTPPPEVTERIVALSNSNFQYPADGELLGDWANGERLASSGKGGHIGTIRPDPPGRKRGANCYACHALARSELSAGNLGPSLTDYGKKTRNVTRHHQVCVSENLQCAGVLSVLANAALRPQRMADARRSCRHCGISA